MLKVGQKAEVEMTGYSAEGLGVCRVEGCAVFVPNAIRGEICEISVTHVSRNSAHGKIERIIRSSPHRIPRACPAAKLCGGCQYHHMDYAEELSAKAQKVTDALTRIGGQSLPEQAAGAALACRDGSQPSAPSGEAAGVPLARRDGSQPSAPSGEAAGAALARSGEHCSPWADEATGNRQQATGQGTGNREPGSEGTGPSAPLRCAQDDNTGASVPVGVSLPLAGVAQAPDFRYIGEVFRTYILVEQGEELILIDKHAAHERINFERLLAQGTQILGQTLLQPQACSFDREEAAVLLEHRELLLSLGYDLDDLGQGDLLLRQIPSDIRESDAAATLSEIAGHIQDGRLDSPQRLRDEALHSIACKAAIKAGYITDPAELRQLAAAVLNNPNLKYCPHGRPICSFITKKQIEKQFKRIT